MNNSPQFFSLNIHQTLEKLMPALCFGVSVDKEFVIRGFTSFSHGKKDYLCFCDRLPSDLHEIEKDSLVLCPHELANDLLSYYPQINLLPCDDARSLFIDCVDAAMSADIVDLNSTIPRPFNIASSVRIPPSSYVHSNVVIEKNVVIGENCTIHSGTWIQEGCTIRDNTVIGANGISLYSGKDGSLRNLPHLAGVVLGANTELGAGCIICKGILNDTVIGSNSIIGNLCNIGHVCQVGSHVWMSAGCLIGGHTVLEDHATLGIGVTVRDNLILGKNAQIGMGSVIIKSVKANTSVFGYPAKPVPPIKAGPSRK